MPDPIDISMHLREEMPTLPRGRGFRSRRTRQMGDGETASVSFIELGVHAGTNEAPLHFIADGAPMRLEPVE